MTSSPADSLNSLADKEVLERLESCVQLFNDEFLTRYDGVHLNVKLLRHAIESYFLDLKRMKSFHGIEFADCHKRAAFSMLWIARAHPIQLATDVKMTEGLLIVNELYALQIGLNHLDIDMAQLSGKYIRNLLYILHFRNPSPEVLASSMYTLECAAKGQKP